MMGRPSSYNDEVAALICGRLSGGESLRAICEDEAMPSQSMVYRWIAVHADFREKYVLAREAQMEAMAEEILEIADTPLEGIRTEESEDGVKVVREDMLGHRRLQIDSRKWLMSKLAPKKYGDKVTTELTGKDGAPIEFADSKDDPNKLRSALIARLGKLGMGGFPTGVSGRTGAAGIEPD